MFSKTDLARALVQTFPKAAMDLLLRTCPDDDTLEVELLKECEHIRVNIHTIISDARDHRVPIYQQPSNDSALGSSLNSLGSPGLDLPIPRAPTHTSLSGQSGTSSHHETGPSPELITAVVARLGQQNEHTLTMKRSRTSSDFSFITKKKVGQLRLSTTACDILLPMRGPVAHGHDSRATQKCQLTWLRSTSDKTHDTTCLIVPSSYIEADFELGHKDYGECALEDDAPDDSPVEGEEAGIRFHSQQSKFRELDGPSYHRSAMSTSDDQTVKQSAEISSFNQGQAHKHGAGHTHNLVDGLIRRQSIRKESPAPSQIPRPSPSPIRTTRSPTPSQPRTQTTPAPSTSSKLNQSTQPLNSMRVKYLWGIDGDVSTIGNLDLTVSGPQFSKFLQEKFQCLLGMPLDRSLHCVRFIPEIGISKFWHLDLDDDSTIEDDWNSTVDWIQEHKSSKKPRLHVVVIEKPHG